MRCIAYPVALLLLASATQARKDADATGVVPLPRAHAHNDYYHDRPLHDALEQGFCSVEADIFLVGDRLLVGHSRRELKLDRSFEELYLQPLHHRVQNEGSKVFAKGPEFTLLVDIKSEGEATYRALQPLLKRYASMLTSVEDGKETRRAVRVILSGNRPTALVENQTERRVGIDGRSEDLDSKKPAHLLPLISDRWGKLFRWRGKGEMPAAERKKLEEFVKKAHDRGRRVRFWATPEDPAVWAVLADAGVDHINTDHLKRLKEFLLERKKQKNEKP